MQLTFVIGKWEDQRHGEIEEETAVHVQRNAAADDAAPVVGRDVWKQVQLPLALQHWRCGASYRSVVLVDERRAGGVGPFKRVGFARGGSSNNSRGDDVHPRGLRAAVVPRLNRRVVSA